MPNVVDRPKSLSDPIAIQLRRARLSDPHMVDLTDFVETIRKETGLNKEIPYFDPLDGGIYAKCLFLFEAPGPGAVRSGFISRNNPDETAKNFFELNQQAGLPREMTISWNVVPWYIGTGIKIRPATKKDIALGIEYLFRLLLRLPHLKIIVLGGKKAQKAESVIRTRYPSVPIIMMPHPSPLYVNNSPENRFHILRSLNHVKEQLLWQ